MSDELYDQLSDLFNKIGYGGRKGPEMIALLKSLFNEDEARTALNLSPFAPEAPVKVLIRARFLKKEYKNSALVCQGKSRHSIL